MLSLEVRYGGQLAGHLFADTREQWTFRYAPTLAGEQWPKWKVVSLRWSDFDRVYTGAETRCWFANLLPGRDVARTLTRKLGFSAGNEFALLQAHGSECPGAVTLHVPGEFGRGGGEYRPLPHDDLRKLVAGLGSQPLLAGVEGAASTLPGDRLKIPVHAAAGAISLALGAVPSSHLLKLGDESLRDTAANERFCMALASRVGLPVAATALPERIGAALLVSRTDRVVTDEGVISAVHMEDFGQLCGLDPDCTYEREGGVTLLDCAELIRRYSIVAALDMRVFIRWVVYGFLVGYGGGHGRQLAILHHATGPRLSPFFGIWSTHIYPALSDRLAMQVGREDRPDWLIAARWRTFAEEIGVRPKYVLGVLRDIAQTLPALANDSLASVEPQVRASVVVDQIRSLIQRRCRQALVALHTETA